MKPRLKIEQNQNKLTLVNVDINMASNIVSLLEDLYQVEYDAPVYPEWNDWSEFVPIDASASDVNFSKFIRSGVYEIYLKDQLIYIGETRCNGSVTNPRARKGMWARRSDFRSTVKGGDNIRNPYGNGTKFLEVYGRTALNEVRHRFHCVHPYYCKQAEQQRLQEYYDKHNTLPTLQSEHDYKRVKK